MEKINCKTVFILLLLLFSNCLLSQSVEDDIKKLVNLTVDMQMIYEVKELVRYEENEQVKKKFLGEYEKATALFYNAYIEFYISKYTPAEIKDMIAFYETPVGKKFANDLLLLSSNSFPKGKEWSKQLIEIKEKLKK